MDEVVMAIIEKKGKYLLVSLNKHLEKFRNFWCPVGGHVEEGEIKEQALKREVKEELNIDVFNLKFITTVLGEIPNKLLHYYLCKTNDSSFEFDKREIREANFFSKQEILNMKLWPSFRKVFEKYIFSE